MKIIYLFSRAERQSRRAFHEKHPNIFLELEEYGSARACDLIQDERLDVALVNMEMHNIDKFYNLVLYREQLLFYIY